MNSILGGGCTIWYDWTARVLGLYGELGRELDNRESWSHYPAPTSPMLERSIACVGAGALRRKQWAVTGRVLPAHGLVVVAAGSGTYVNADGREETVRGPSAIWLFPGVRHGYAPDHGGWDERWLLFAGRTASLFEDLGVLAPDRPVQRLPEVPRGFVRSFDDLRDEVGRFGPLSELRASLAVQSAIVAVAAAGPVASNVRSQDDILRTLADEADLPLSVAERATRAGLSVPALRALVRSAAGLSPAQFVVSVRMSRAQELLTESDLPVAAVGMRVGIDDPAYFSRQFRRYTGLTAGAFRRRHRGESRDSVEIA